MARPKPSAIYDEEAKLWKAETMQKEYPQLAHTTYLDHVGATLYPQSAIQSFAADMTANLYGNPHSASPSSSLSTAVIREVRTEVLKRFGASLDDFDLIFVPNATAAIKLVAHAFQDQDEGFWYGYHKDSHSSLVGVRELAKNGHHCFRSDDEVNHWIDSDVLYPGRLALFGYPAQSNMTGYRPPLAWGSQIRRVVSVQNKQVYTLLDAASYLTTSNLNLNDQTFAPDFIALSLYKIFGFPDLGALIVRREAAPMLLSRKYFGGGTAEMVIAVGDSNGMLIGKTRVEALASACGFQFRTGSLCNPGGIATIFGFRPWEMRRNFSYGMRCGDDLDFLGGKPTGVVRVSLGAMTSNSDIERFLDFIDFFFVCKSVIEEAKAARKPGESLQNPVTSIQPIRSCMPLAVPHGDFTSLTEAGAAYAPWHENWVVVDPNSNTEIHGRERHLRKLAVDLRPLEGRMIITHVGEESTSKSSVHSLELDLWDPASDQYHINLYPHDATSKDFDPAKSVSANAEAFVASVLGMPATLSRRFINREILELKQRTHICVVWSCQRNCGTLESLLQHYDLHARKFAKRKPSVVSQAQNWRDIT
ncbi:uncharacterized protein A1O9_05152 [Exophiala aquamarina CBS 119918]|uniref:Aminotransferase class V domain-containing protein n=1 Tax=Exophiala aquamarina CBS 119918 TaxID=1182545 RepID=A0A072PKC5_9EURO|nr:uncharacterized protein A1O9_05152 [Exophiala aquamarina CBS 119918]KEF60301.1 hypothetical protein A1O9_05152 [Exophiala aquamarina CBS 119918]